MLSPDQKSVETVVLSRQCWNCLDSLREVAYAYSYSYFWGHEIKRGQLALRYLFPDIKEDRLKLMSDGRWVQFEMSDGAIALYKPVIEEVSSFGTAVKMIGIYERYIMKLAEIADLQIPEAMAKFRQSRKRKPADKDTKFLLKADAGRGIDFLSQVFKYRPDSFYRPSLNFVFELRNVAVHNLGVVDKRLCDAAGPECIKVAGGIKIGDTFAWNFAAVTQLQHLFIQLLTESDPRIRQVLRVAAEEKPIYWSMSAAQ
jgi:hypothetical protein